MLPKYKYNRCSLRLSHYDYSKSGYYFVTICTLDRLHLFGEIVDELMALNAAGSMIKALWNEIINDFKNIKLHEFVIMPNHIHGIIEIVGVPLVGTQNIHKKRAPMKDAPTIGDVIGAFKSKTTNKYINMVKNGILPPFSKRIWQRNYHEHIIRNDADYERVATYTINNPKTWEYDILSKAYEP